MYVYLTACCLVCRRVLHDGDQLQFQRSRCGICGVQNSSWTDFPSASSLPPCQLLFHRCSTFSLLPSGWTAGLLVAKVWPKYSLNPPTDKTRIKFPMNSLQLLLLNSLTRLSGVVAHNTETLIKRKRFDISWFLGFSTVFRVPDDDVSEVFVGSIFNWLNYLWRWNRQRVPKRRRQPTYATHQGISFGSRWKLKDKEKFCLHSACFINLRF